MDKDTKKLIKNYQILQKECRLNIRDARKARRHCDKSDQVIYSKVIEFNRINHRDAKQKIAILKTMNGKSWYLWIAAILFCLLLLLAFPFSPILVILSPLIFLIGFGLLGLIFMLHR